MRTISPREEPVAFTSRVSDLISSYFQGVGNYSQGPGRSRDHSLELTTKPGVRVKTHAVRHDVELRSPSHDWVVSR